MIFQHAGAALRGRFLKIFAMWGYTRRNHPCQISSRLVKRFGVYGLRVPKIGCFSASHDLRHYNSVTQCDTL